MIQYIFKRILIFIPTFFVISLLIFGLSKMAPGDPVTVVMGGSDAAAGGQRADLVNSEKVYEEVAAQLGLDKPSFYFVLTSAAYPADLYKIRRKNHRETISRLIAEYGNSEAIMGYYQLLKSIQYRILDIKPNNFEVWQTARNCIGGLLNDYDKGGIEFKLQQLKDSLATKNHGLEALEPACDSLFAQYNYIKENPQRSNLYWPQIHWYGLNTQYHTWMFGDYPWLSSVDSSGYHRIDELLVDIKALVPQKRALETTISQLKGKNKRLNLQLEDSKETALSDSLLQALEDNTVRLTNLMQEQRTLNDTLDLLNQERNTISAGLPRYASKGFIRGDFGISYIDKKPVATKITEALYWTLIMNVFAIIIAYLISIPLGVRSAIWKLKGKSTIDNINTTVLFVLYSLPSFWIGTILLVFLTTSEYSDWLNWFPTSGAQDLDLASDPNVSVWRKVLDVLHHLALPIFCITYGTLAFLSRQMRGAMLGVIRQDYIRTARAKGLKESKVIWKHAFRNSLFPIITLFSSVFPRALSGSIAIELIYAIPGMGQLVLMSITSRDWPVVFTIVMFAALLTIIGNLIADILYALVDPRISFK